MSTNKTQQALKLYQQGAYIRAAEEFNTLAQAYYKEGDHLSAAEMLNNKCVALLMADDARGALDAAQGTEIVFANADDNARHAMALGNQAACQEELANYQEAIILYESAAELFKDIGDNEHYSLVKGKISSIQLISGNKIHALLTMKDALEAKQKLSLKEKFLSKLFKLPTRIIR